MHVHKSLKYAQASTLFTGGLTEDDTVICKEEMWYFGASWASGYTSDFFVPCGLIEESW